MRTSTSVCLILFTVALAVPALAETVPLTPGQTNIEFSVSNFAVHTVKGSFEKFSGQVELDPTDITRSKVKVVIDAASINTGNAHRDEHLKTADFFDVTRFPQLTFESDRIERQGDHYTITGPLTMHGVTHVVTIGVVIKSASPLQAEGTTEVDRTDYGLKYGSAFSVGHKVAIHLSILK